MRRETFSTFNKDKEYVLAIWQDYPETSKFIRGCYASFYREVFKEDLNYYFSFPGLPLWYKDFIEEFNSKFKNIKYKIIAERKGFWNKFKDYYGTSYVFSEGVPTSSVFTRVAVPLLSIELSENYDKDVIKYLYYFFHHLIRVTSIFEDYINRDYFNVRPEDRNYLKFVLNANNRGEGYRSLSEIEIDENDLLKFDDCELVNSKLKNRAFSLTQTDIVFALLKEGTYNIKVGDIVYAPVSYNYKNGSYDFKLCKVREINFRTVYLVAYDRDFPNPYVSYIDKLKLFKSKDSNRKGKFKIGDQIKTKLTKLKVERKMEWGVVAKIYDQNLIKILTYDGDEFIADENNFKLIPKAERGSLNKFLYTE